VSNYSATKCDGPGCKKRAEDFYATRGWINVANGSISITRGRKQDKSARTGFIAASPSGVHYCSIKCLSDALTDAKP
jgi:hypothetical protein